MKLKNKKTGEVATLTLSSNGEELLLMKNNELVTHNVKLSDLDEWEDMPEEPKEYWYIDPMVCGVYFTKIKNDEDLCEFNKQIGNYFETKEEAEKAVEKLKAWKRLKDKGFKFTGFTHKDRGRLDELEIYCQLGERPEDIEDMEDIRLLFGGEE